MIIALIVLATLGSYGWSVAYRERLRCLRYEGVLEALRSSGHSTQTLVDTLVAVHGVETLR